MRRSTLYTSTVAIIALAFMAGAILAQSLIGQQAQAQVIAKRSDPCNVYTSATYRVAATGLTVESTKGMVNCYENIAKLVAQGWQIDAGTFDEGRGIWVLHLTK